MNQHQCVKCKSAYQDSDPDAYLCATCIELKKDIAAKIDAQFAVRPRVTVKSDLDIFEETGQTMEVDGRRVTFNRA